VTNRTRGWARINLDINIADPAQLDVARAIIDQAGRDLAADPTVGPLVIEPPRFMMVKDIGEPGICLLVWGRVNAADRFAVEGEYRRRLLEALTAARVILVTATRVDLVGPQTRSAGPTRAGRPR
jgi:small-conductance mechanosensitive channel